MNDLYDPEWQIGALVRPTESVGPDMLCGQLLERLSQSSGEPLVPIVSDGRPAGLIDRAEFLAEFARLYRLDLFARKPVSQMMGAMKHPALVLDAATPIETAHAALAQDASGALPVGFIAAANWSIAVM